LVLFAASYQLNKENVMKTVATVQRVLIVDEYDIFRIGLRSILEIGLGLEIAGEAKTGEDAVALAKRLSPDLVVMEIDLPVLSGIDATVQIIAEAPSTKVIAVSTFEDSTSVRRMLDAGAEGYIPKRRALKELPFAVESVLAGNIYLSPGVARDVLADYAAQRADPFRRARTVLSSPELRILQLAAEGKTPSEIGKRLNLGTDTVEAERKKIERKLGVTGTAEMTKYELREGVTDSDKAKPDPWRPYSKP
jgi:two-component system NarL family response regulator